MHLGFGKRSEGIGLLMWSGPCAFVGRLGLKKWSGLCGLCVI